MSRVRLLFDEDFNGHIVRGFRRRKPQADHAPYAKPALRAQTTRPFSSGPPFTGAWWSRMIVAP